MDVNGSVEPMETELKTTIEMVTFDVNVFDASCQSDFRLTSERFMAVSVSLDVHALAKALVTREVTHIDEHQITG